MIYKILKGILNYQRNGSGWSFKEVLSLETHTVAYKLKGSSYIPPPNFIMRKKANLNVENKDDKCFQWCVLKNLHPVNIKRTRINDLKKYKNDLNFKDNQFPVKVKDRTKFEKQNPNIPKINVFSMNEQNKIYLLRINESQCENLIDLFLLILRKMENPIIL